MADTVCSKLNYTVGDGTTSAIIATNAVYDAIYDSLGELNYYKSREITKSFNRIKERLVSELRNMAVDIRSTSPEKLTDIISKIARVSSNGDTQIVDIITNLYKELQYPAITVSMSKDGETKGTVVNGYPAEVMLTDQLYINNDNKTMMLSNADVIVFDHKVNEITYQDIIKPLHYHCKACGRSLIVIAPFYDETALTGPIRRDILDEYNKSKETSLVLTVCRHTSGSHKLMLADLAMLLNTDLISVGMESDIIQGASSRSNGINYYINIDDRHIPNTLVCAVDRVKHSFFTIREEERNMYDMFDFTVDEKGEPTNIPRIRLGFVGKCELGLDKSVFSEFIYNEDLYKKTVAEAERQLDDTINTYKKLGTFTTEISEKQKRLFRLNMKMGIIEVGGESELSQKYNKDAIDDTVRATESAFNNGIIAGSHVTMLHIIKHILEEEELEPLNNTLLCALYDGFKYVYKSVLLNAGCDEGKIDDIIKRSIESGITYNIETEEYDDNILTSCETDTEILGAVIDLVGLISTSNQLVICEQRGAC